MAKLVVEQKSVFDLFKDKKANFLIPNYQRPYAWEEKELQTLWDDIFDFAFPDKELMRFDTDSEYYLGAIVTYLNSEGKREIIDGQQRLTTLLLLLRAFYSSFGAMQDENTKKTKGKIEQCLWKTDEDDNPDRSALKIDSEVATDNDKEEFLSILRSGVVDVSQKSRYAENYRYFLKKIQEFKSDYPDYFRFFPNRLLTNCILLPIEAENQETALTIFSTLNNRGMPLCDADIFKAQFYEYYKKQGRTDYFINIWTDLSERCERIFKPLYGTPMDDLFTRYMYYERALITENKSASTTEGIRTFFSKNKYELFKRESTLKNLQDLALFWEDVYTQNADRFSERILRKLFVLCYAPNTMWAYITTVYYMHNRQADGQLDDDAFYAFLDKITAFVWIYTITNPGVSALRSPIYVEMQRIVKGESVTFDSAKAKLERSNVETMLENYRFVNNRPITKSFLVWWAFEQEGQQLLSIETKFDIEHIFPRNRQEMERTLSDTSVLEKIGNKAILENRINIGASDYKFEGKKKYYKGFVTDRGKVKEPTANAELLSMAESKADFTEQDINERSNAILRAFVSYMERNGLIE